MKFRRKLIVGLLAVLMVTSSVPVSVLADELENNSETLAAEEISLDCGDCEKDMAEAETEAEADADAEVEAAEVETAAEAEAEYADSEDEAENEAKAGNEAEYAEAADEEDALEPETSEESQNTEAEDNQEQALNSDVAEDDICTPVIEDADIPDVDLQATPGRHYKIGEDVYVDLYASSTSSYTYVKAVITGNGPMYNDTVAIPITSDVKTVIIEDGVTTIKPNAFYLKQITSITIPSSVTEIGEKAFSNCTSLETIVLPDSVTKIGKSAFEGCSKLTNVTLPAKIKTLPNSLFENCSALKKIKIPSTVTSIGSYAFIFCTNLTSVNIPSGVTKLSDGMFYGSGLTSFTVPSQVTSIGYATFYNCKKLTSITLPSGLKTIDSAAFSGCVELKSVTIPSGIVGIKMETFSNCTSLTSIVIPDSVATIGSNAFYNCIALEDVTLSKNLVEIGSKAFMNCESLKTISLPDSVKNVYSKAFTGCKNLDTVVCSCKFVSSLEALNYSFTVVPRHFFKSGSSKCSYCSQGDKVEDFAARLYTTCLGRSPEPSGKAYWVKALRSGTSGADAAYKFFFSDEFIKKNLSNDEYIRRLYRTFMDREADSTGLAYWKNKLASGATRLDVFNGFVVSKEWKTVCENYGIAPGLPQERVVTLAEKFATRLYTTCLGRNPEPTGLKYWIDALGTHRINGAKAAYQFFFSKEFISRNFSNEEFIKRLYRTCLGREADSSGLKYWLGQFASGKTREYVFDDFVRSNEFKKMCADSNIEYVYPGYLN